MPQEITVYVDNLPKGAIIMWSGDVNHLPIGWALCDGTHDTPDLRDRFPIGAGNKYKLGDVGGSEIVTIEVSHLPSHTHECLTNNDGGHSHVSSFNHRGFDTGDAQGLTDNLNHFNFQAVTSGGSHVHKFTTDKTGLGRPINFIPPYKAVYYIIKV